MIIQVIGKQSWTNETKGKSYYVLHTCFKKENVIGNAVKDRFVNEGIFNKVEVGKNYKPVFEESFNGSAILADMVEYVR